MDIMTDPTIQPEQNPAPDHVADATPNPAAELSQEGGATQDTSQNVNAEPADNRDNRASNRKREQDGDVDAEAEQRRERYRAEAQALQERLAQDVQTLTESDRWRQFLRFTGSFHNYSLNNVLLIQSQKPDASYVAGYRQWQAKGRQVKRGEKALTIYGYAVDKRDVVDPATGQTTVEEQAWFPIRRIFDISQTDLKPGATDHSSVTDRLAKDDPANIADSIRDKVATLMRQQGWSVESAELSNGADGVTTLDGSQRIIIDSRLSPADAAATMLHEAAHALLHTTPQNGPSSQSGQTPAGTTGTVGHRGIAEIEAESVAYATAHLAGLDTSKYSVGYVAGWAYGDPDKIRQAAHRVLRGVHELAPAILDTPTTEEQTDDQISQDAERNIDREADRGDAVDTSASSGAGARGDAAPTVGARSPLLVTGGRPAESPLRHALVAAERGWFVFPLAPNGKTPTIKEWQERATTDPMQIEQWWSDNPGRNIGIATGPSGLLVIDCDTRKPGEPVPEEFEQTWIRDGQGVLADLEGVYGDLPDTYMVHTPSGGLHLYFAAPDGVELGNTASRLGWLIDTRGTGGYIVGAGSTIDHRPYTQAPPGRSGGAVAPLPEWVADQLTRTAPKAEPNVPEEEARRRAYLEAAVHHEVQRVLQSGAHQHNHALFIASASLGKLAGAGHLDRAMVRGALLAAGEAVGQPPKEARATINSGLRSGQQNAAHQPAQPAGRHTELHREKETEREAATTSEQDADPQPATQSVPAVSRSTHEATAETPAGATREATSNKAETSTGVEQAPATLSTAATASSGETTVDRGDATDPAASRVDGGAPVELAGFSSLDRAQLLIVVEDWAANYAHGPGLGRDSVARYVAETATQVCEKHGFGRTWEAAAALINAHPEVLKQPTDQAERDRRTTERTAHAEQLVTTAGHAYQRGDQTAAMRLLEQAELADPTNSMTASTVDRCRQQVRQATEPGDDPAAGGDGSGDEPDTGTPAHPAPREPRDPVGPAGPNHPGAVDDLDGPAEAAPTNRADAANAEAGKPISTTAAQQVARSAGRPSQHQTSERASDQDRETDHDQNRDGDRRGYVEGAVRGSAARALATGNDGDRRQVLAQLGQLGGSAPLNRSTLFAGMATVMSAARVGVEVARAGHAVQRLEQQRAEQQPHPRPPATERSADQATGRATAMESGRDVRGMEGPAS